MDNTYATGQVGLGFYRDASSLYNQLWVDWARLQVPISGTLSSTVNAQQRLLNEEGQDAVDTDEVAP